MKQIKRMIVGIGVALGCWTATDAQEVLLQKRNDMVRQQIENRGITHPAVLRAMRKVERHQFVPPDYQDQAYEDRPLPIGYGQTISQPYIVAFMTELIDPKPGDRVLEVGTGSGYQTAVLAEIVQEVYSIEIVEELGIQAGLLLKELGYQNAHVRIGDGYAGWPEHAPFNAIIVAAAAPEIPAPLIEQLKEGGKMVIPVGSSYLSQTLMVVEKKKGGKIRKRSVAPVRFVPFTREEE